MKKWILWICLSLISVIVISIAVVAIVREESFYDTISFFRRGCIDLPESGIWVNEELGITLDYGTGYGVLKTAQDDIICQIGGEFNTSIIHLSVDFWKNDDSCSIPKGTYIFSGEYESVEPDKFCLREYGTRKEYWFYRIE